MELFRLFAMLLAVGCMIVSLLGVGGAVIDRLDIFNHFAPITLALALLAALVQASFRRTMEKPTLACALIAVLVSGAMMMPEFMAKAAQQRVSPRGQTIKVIELNSWSNNVDVRQTARWLMAQQADVLVVEEVVANSATIPELVKRVYPYRNDCDPEVPCTTRILSRRRPTASGVFPAPDADGLHSSAWATFGEGSSAYAVVGTHAPWPRPKDNQQAQTALLASHLDGFDRRSLIVAGDFNSTPWSFSLRRQDDMFGIERRTRALFTFPVQKYSYYHVNTPVPFLPLDHIYAGSSWKTVLVTRGARTGSDHLPTVAILTR